MRSSKFTLMELLIVIAIIGILATLLLPSLGRAKKKAQSAVCLSQQKSIGKAFAMLAKNNNQKAPRGQHGDGYDNMTTYEIRKYLGIKQDGVDDKNSKTQLNAFYRRHAIYQCPSYDPTYSLSYLVSSFDFRELPGEEELRYNGWDFIDRPESQSKTALFVEGNTDYLDSEEISNCNIWVYRDLPWEDGRMMQPGDDTHLQRTNVLYFDQHASSHTLKNRNAFTKGFLDGLNFDQYP